jgi:hypothetical protein
MYSRCRNLRKCNGRPTYQLRSCIFFYLIVGCRNRTHFPFRNGLESSLVLRFALCTESLIEFSASMIESECWEFTSIVARVSSLDVMLLVLWRFSIKPSAGGVFPFVYCSISGSYPVIPISFNDWVTLRILTCDLLLHNQISRPDGTWHFLSLHNYSMMVVSATLQG